MYRHPPDSSHALRYIGMKFAAIINPEVRKPAPKPVRVDLRMTFLIGCVLWSVALIVSAILLACGLLKGQTRSSRDRLMDMTILA